MQKLKKRTRRPLIFVFLGLLMCGMAGWLFYDHKLPDNPVLEQKKYSYQIEQSLESSAHYEENEYFDPSGSPGENNKVYVQQLTDYLDSKLDYSFNASDSVKLNYTYKIEAVLYSKFSGKESTENAQNVWTKNYTLLEPVTDSQTTNALKLNPSVRIPFAEYAKEVNDFRSAYNIPVSSEAVVTYTVQVEGESNGVPFTNTQLSKVIVPLDQQLYKISTEVNKSEAQEIKPPVHWNWRDILTAYELIVAAVLAVLGLVAIIYGLRKQIIKSPYQRELARIYRYNDGIIVKARRPVSLTHKTIVDLSSFDDLLSVEEETGTPIIANEISDSETRFIIADDETAYVYTLGGSTPKEDWENKQPKPPVPSSTPRQNPPKQKTIQL